MDPTVRRRIPRQGDTVGAMTDDPARALAHRLGNLCGVIRTQAEVVREIDDPAALRRALDIIERAAIGR